MIISEAPPSDTRDGLFDEVIELRQRVHVLTRENEKLRDERDRAILARDESMAGLMRVARR